MNVRTKYILAILGIPILSGLVMLASVWYTPQYPALSFVPLVVLLGSFVAVVWVVRRFQGQLPSATAEEKQTAVRAHRRLAWIYIAGLLLGVATEIRDLLALPHGLGYLLPLIPIGLAARHFRIAAMLNRGANQPVS